MGRVDSSLTFGSWAGTIHDLDETIISLRRVLPSSSVSVRSLSSGERVIEHGDIADVTPRTDPFQIVVRGHDHAGRSLLVVLGYDLPASAILQDDDEEHDEVPGNMITATAETSTEAVNVANRALDVLGHGVPRWAKWQRRSHMSPVRLENAAALLLVFVGLTAGVVVVWPEGLFFGLFIGLVLLSLGLEVVGKMFPPFEIHMGRPRWRRRWWPAALLIAVPLVTAAVLRVLLERWGI